MVKEHTHSYFPYQVAYMRIADDIPEYFLARFACKEEDCEETIIGIAESQEA